MKRFVLSRAARTDVKEIWVYIAEDSVDAADRWRSKLRLVFQTLADDPGIGHRRVDLTGMDVLFWGFGAYLVVYMPGPVRIEIVGVMHGARDLPVLLARRLDP